MKCTTLHLWAANLNHSSLPIFVWFFLHLLAAVNGVFMSALMINESWTGCRVPNEMNSNHYICWIIAAQLDALQKGWDYTYWWQILKMNSRNWCDCLCHGEFHSSDTKYVYLYLTDIYAFVFTGQDNIFEAWCYYKTLVRHVKSATSADFYSHYTM